MIPISLLQGNVVFDKGGAPYAVYILESIPYAFQNKNIKISAIERIAKSLYGYVGEMFLYLLARQYSAEQVAEQMSEFSMSEGWKRQIKYTYKHLQRELPFERVNYLVIPLKKRAAIYYDQDKVAFVKELGKNSMLAFQDVQEKLFRPFTKQEISFSEEFLEQMQQQADDMLDQLAFQGIRKATMRETEWWLKKAYHRGLPDPELILPDPFPTQVRVGAGEVRRVMPVGASLFTLSKLSREHMDYMESRTDDGISYSSYLPILHVPPEIDEYDPTGFEWIYGIVEQMDFPVDTALRITIESSVEAAKKIKRRRKVVKGQIKEWKSGNQEIPEEVLEDLDGINGVLRKFRERKTPLLHLTGVFAVGDSSLKELQLRKKRLIDRAGKMDVILANSPGDQLKMFQHFYPFSKSQLPDRWKIPMEPGTLGAAVPLGVRKLGDPSGFHFATLLGTKRPVFMNPKRPAMDKSLNRANTVLVVGVPGAGKTATLKFIIYNLVEWDAYGYVEDPKGDFPRFFEHPTIAKNGRIASFTPGSSTTFTPFRLSEIPSERTAAALTILDLLLNPAGANKNETRSFVIGEALESLYRKTKWDMDHYQRELEWIVKKHSKETYRNEAEMCLGYIQRLRNNGIASQMFGEDDGTSLFDRKILIAITRGLKIPDRKQAPSEWTEDERTSVAIKYATSTIGLDRLLSLPNHVPKFYALEEYWILKKFPGGKQLYEKAIRFARSSNMTVILSTQNPTDSEEDENEESDDVNGLFSWKIILRLDSTDQVRSALKLLGMSEERPQDWIEAFSRVYKNGKGLAKDPEGNIGEIQVEPLDPDLMYYLESTPEVTPEGVKMA